MMTDISKPKIVLDYCKHCGDKQNLEVLAESKKQVHWLPPDIDQLSHDELQELGSVPYSIFRWEIQFCPNCQNVNIIQGEAYSEWFDCKYDDTGNPVQEIWNWQSEILYPRHQQDDLVTHIQDNVVRAEAQRGISKLTLDEVDLGLFILGRAFDVVSKKYFIALAKNGKIITKNGSLISEEDANDSNKFKLSTRIDLFISNGILDDENVLHLLRKERNDPAHNISTLKRRRESLASASTYANCYLGYIILFEERMTELLI